MRLFNEAIEQAYYSGTLDKLLEGLYATIEKALNKEIGKEYSYSFNEEGLTVTGVKNPYCLVDEDGGTILSTVAYNCRSFFCTSDNYIYFDKVIFNEYLLENIGE